MFGPGAYEHHEAAKTTPLPQTAPSGLGGFLQQIPGDRVIGITCTMFPNTKTVRVRELDSRLHNLQLTLVLSVVARPFPNKSIRENCSKTCAYTS